MKIELKDKSVAFVQSHDLEYIHPLSRKIQRYFFLMFLLLYAVLLF